MPCHLYCSGDDRYIVGLFVCKGNEKREDKVGKFILIKQGFITNINIAKLNINVLY